MIIRFLLLLTISFQHGYVGALSATTKLLTPSSSISPNSRFFLDTAVEAEWDELLPLGIFHGVTTNPTLLERANHPCTISHVKSLAETALSHSNCNEFMCQAWGLTADKMYKVGMELATIEGKPSKNIVIKVPVTFEGTKAASMLIGSGVRVCLTACYASHQALVAANVGAEYLAPYLGRMNDAGKDGESEILKMQQIVESFGSRYSDGANRTRIFVASIRNVESMVELASKGLDTFTFSPDIARALFMEPLTQTATEDFELAASKGKEDVEV